MVRKVRSDKTVGKLEENAGLPNGAIRNKDGKSAVDLANEIGDKELIDILKSKR